MQCLRTLILLSAIILSPFLISAQISLSGIVQNDKGLPLENANILAIPQDDIGKMVFTITKTNGSFILNLKANASYKVVISFLGYVTEEKKLTTTKEDIVLDVFLKEDINLLNEVTIEYKPPVVFKKDTTTYNVSAFISGKERKLREILKKLPGVEVDKSGNVTANGKKVTQVLVENRKFFNGKSKLAVNNIPADVVSEVEIIEDYHETAFMKGLEDSEEVAMNISLKEDKKNFIFGAVESGIGIENRYLVHPTFFKYGPKTTYNLIGDLNNTVQKSFTLSNYLDFEGGLNKDNRNSFFDSNVVRFLRNRDFKDNTHHFGGLNIQHNPNDKIEWRTFIIGLKDKNLFLSDHIFEYLSENISEFRDIQVENNTSIFLGKSQLKIKPNSRTVINLVSSLEKNNSNSKDNVSTVTTIDNSYLKYVDYGNAKFNLKVKAEKQFSKAHTSRITADYEYIKTNNSNFWNSYANLFFEGLPIIENEEYRINQDEYLKRNAFNWNFTHFWIINRKNHVYFNTGTDLTWFDLSNNAYQELLNNVQINQFNDYSNSLLNNQSVFYTSMQYKTFIWKILTQAKVNYNNYYWSNKQEVLNNKHQAVILPELKLTYDINNQKNIEFSYIERGFIPKAEQLILNNRIVSFNNVFQGNPYLQLYFLKSTRLIFNHSKSNGFGYYMSLRYSERKRAIENSSTFNDIYFLDNPFNISTPNTNFHVRLKSVYNKPYWKLSATATFNSGKSNTIINTEKIQSNFKQYNYNIKGFTKFEEYPNIEIELDHLISKNKSGNYSNELNQTILNIDASYDLKNWKFGLEYQNTYFMNDFLGRTNSKFNNINATIFYNKEDSPFGLELRLFNLNDNKFKLESSFSPYFFEETKTFLFPRTIMLIASYKL